MLELEPFAYCFQDKNRWRIDDVLAELIRLDVGDDGVLSADDCIRAEC